MLPRLPEPDEIAVRIGGRWRMFRREDPGRRTAHAVFPGAFNPLHQGHCRMAEIAGEILGAAVEFELSICNVDKVPLDREEVVRRAGQFPTEAVVWVTRAATFVEKARWFPGCVFVVGADTIRRIADSRYYANHPALRDEAIESIVRQGCRFLVFGRLLDGRFQTLADLAIPARLRDLCDEVPADRFRLDISSTELRRLAGTRDQSRTKG